MKTLDFTALRLDFWREMVLTVHIRPWSTSTFLICRPDPSRYWQGSGGSRDSTVASRESSESSFSLSAVSTSSCGIRGTIEIIETFWTCQKDSKGASWRDSMTHILQFGSLLVLCLQNPSRWSFQTGPAISFGAFFQHFPGLKVFYLTSFHKSLRRPSNNDNPNNRNPKNWIQPTGAQKTWSTNQCNTPRKFNIAPKNRQSQKETHLPTIIFQGLC